MTNEDDSEFPFLYLLMGAPGTEKSFAVELLQDLAESDEKDL